MRLVGAVLMPLLYYAIVAPLGVVIRLAGRDLLRVQSDPAAPSYWIVRRAPGPPPATMKRQF
jgi:hypothetical protein